MILKMQQQQQKISDTASEKLCYKRKWGKFAKEYSSFNFSYMLDG